MGIPDQPVPAEAGGGKYISLATDLSPEPVVVKEETTQSKLLERWTKTQAVAQNKVFRLGSQETVEAGIDKAGSLSIKMTMIMMMMMMTMTMTMTTMMMMTTMKLMIMLLLMMMMTTLTMMMMVMVMMMMLLMMMIAP